MLDEIGKAMDELHELSLDMNKQLTLQNDLIGEVEYVIVHFSNRIILCVFFSVFFSVFFFKDHHSVHTFISSGCSHSLF